MGPSKPDPGSRHTSPSAARPREAAGTRRKTGLLERLAAALGALADPEKDKRRLLTDIGRQLKTDKQRLYGPKKKQALPAMASLFFDFYKTVVAAKALLGRAESSAVLRGVLIESFFSDRQRGIIESLQEAAIVARVAAEAPNVLAGQLKEDLISLVSGFDTDAVRRINHDYNQLITFLDLVHFDYYFLLRKFDSSLVEGNVSTVPRFEPLDGAYVVDDLKEFLDLILGVDLGADWDRLLGVLKAYREVEVVSRQDWKRLLRQVAALRRSGVLELVVRHIGEDPFYKPAPVAHRERIVDGYFQKLKAQAELTLQKILQGRREEKREELAARVFGTSAVVRLGHYGEKANLGFRKKMLGGFIHVASLNYVKAFLDDHFKGSVRSVVDLLLIRGTWSTHVMSNQLSEALHKTLELSDRLSKFDESLGDEGELSARLRVAVRKADRDKAALPQLRKLLHEANETARTIMVETVQSLIVIAKNLRGMIEDFDRAAAELILNWKEMDGFMDNQAKVKMVGVYKQIYYFIQLMQYFLK